MSKGHFSQDTTCKSVVPEDYNTIEKPPDNYCVVIVVQHVIGVFVIILVYCVTNCMQVRNM